MIKKELNDLDLTVYEEKLDNGLSVYLVPVNNVNSVYATLSTNFGGDMEEFIPIESKKMIKMPRGIAHFIEHQMFNQEDGTDIFAFYSERGTNCNANTRNNKTTYLFSGVNFIEDNLNKLLDFVFEPYFTDESIAKEQGIIKEEIGMYNDDPYTKITYQLYNNVFKVHPMKTPLIGNDKSIEKITKDDLYTCYQTFYQPSNMYLIVTGNIIPEKIIELVKNNFSKKELVTNKPITVKTYNEPDKVAVKEQNMDLKVATPKLALAYKINISNLKNVRKHEILLYLSFLFDSKLGPTSLFLEQLKKDDLIIDNFFISTIDIKTHAVVMIQADTNYPKKLYERIKKELNEIKISEEELNRRKKVLMSYQVLGSENIYQINLKLMNNLSNDGEIIYDAYNDIRNLNIKQFNYIINNIDLDNNSVIYVESKN